MQEMQSEAYAESAAVLALVQMNATWIGHWQAYQRVKQESTYLYILCADLIIFLITALLPL